MAICMKIHYLYYELFTERGRWNNTGSRGVVHRDVVELCKQTHMFKGAEKRAKPTFVIYICLHLISEFWRIAYVDNCSSHLKTDLI